MTIPLSYGRETSRFNWRRVRRYVFGAMVLAFAITLFVFRDPITAPFRRVYWQARLDLAADNQKAIFAETKFERQNPDSESFTRWADNDPPASWSAFANSAGLSPYVPLYMGLHSLNSKRRLVVVWKLGSWNGAGALNPPPDTLTMPLIAEVFDPASLFSAPRSLKISPTTAVYLPVDQLLTLYAGSHRPNTVDRIELPFRSGQNAGLIVGQLLPDDTVTFEVESGPATLTPNVPIAPIK